MSEAQKQRLAALGELHYHDAVLGDDSVGSLCPGADAIVITPRLAADIVPCLDRCRIVSVQGAGTDALDVAAARRKGIVISNVPDFCTDAVAEHAFALLLAAAKRIEQGREWLATGRWTTALAYTTVELSGKTLGLFGCGKIGARIAEIAAAYRMRVVATVRNPGKPHPAPAVPFETLLAESDFLVLAAPATGETTGVFDARAFAQMKPGVVVVNISRAALVEEAALIEALASGRIAAAGIDVFHREPPPTDDPLLDYPQVVVSPHVAWGSEEALQRLLDLSIANVEAFAAGKPINVVS
jgi:glycerate dehydrogenase